MKKFKQTMLALLLCCLCVGLSACGAKAKTFSKEGLTITLTTESQEKEIVSQTLYLQSSDVIFVALKDFIVTLISIPAADVVEVVRCKDCKHLLQDLSEREAHLCMRNRFERVGVSLDDFCSYGKRRE